MVNASPGNEATRRSARKRSAPVLFEAGGARRVRGRKSTDRGGDDTELHEQAPDEDDDDARMDPGDEEGEEDDDEEDVPPKSKITKSKRGRKSLTSRSKARGKKDKNMNHILLAVRDKRTSLVQVARELIHAEQPGSAGADLVMFILACCGASERAGKRAIPESELFDNKFDLSDKEVKELCKDVATSADCYAETYPLAGGSSEWRDFPQVFGKFWMLVAQEGADAFVTDGDSPVLRFIYDTLEKLAEAPLLSFRHTSVATMGALGSGLIEVLSEQLERLNKALKQLSTAWTKSLGGKRSSNASSSGDFEELEEALKAFAKAPNEENQSTAQEALAKWKKASKAGASKVAVLKSLTSTCEELYDTIAFLYSFLWSMLGDDMLSGRCKDANPVVRIASLQAIGSWVCKMPNYFFSKAKIAVFQALQSASPKVRVAACRQVTALLSQDDEDEDRAAIVASVLKEDKQWLRLVSQRVTLLLQGKDAVVGSAAIGTLIAIYRFDPSVVLTEEVQKCLCIEGHEWRPVRIQVAEFCMESVRGLGEPTGSLSTKAKVTDAAVIAKARLQLSSFIELLSQLLENDVEVEDTGKKLKQSQDLSEGEDPPTLPSRVMYLVVDAFWTHPQAGFLRNFKAMCAVLRSYGESDASNTIIVYKARMVASTLRAAARRASWLDPAITSKRELKAQTALREELKASLHEALASTLADCLVAFRSDTVVLEELVPLINNFDPSLCTKDVDRRNLEVVTKTVCQLLGQQSAGNILFSLATVLSRHLCSVAHPSLADALSAQTKAYDASTKDLRRALKAHPESEDEALVALEHASRRFAMLSRVADREYWNTLNTNMRLELKNAALELAKSASDKQRAQSTLSELLLILQLDVTDHVALASEAAQDVELDKDEFVQVLNEAVECRDSLISVLEQAVGLFQSSNDTASLCSLLLPTYLDLRIICTGRLKGTLLSRLAWSPALSLCEAMDKATELIVKSSSEKAPLAFQGPFAVRQGVVLPSLRVSAYARGPLLSFSKEIFDKVLRIHVEEDEEEDNEDGREEEEEEEENAHSAKLLHSALLEADPRTWGLYAISSLRDYFNSKNRTATTALAQFLSKELCVRKRSCPDSYVPAIVTIIAEGTKFALSDADNLMFLDMVKPFVEKLRVKQLQDARLSWKTQLEGMSKPLATAIFAGQQTAKNKHFANFEKALGVTTKRAKPVPEDDDTGASSENSSAEDEVVNEAPERQSKDTAGSVMSDESKKEIEKNLFESDSESVKAAAKRRRMAKRTLSSPGPDEKEDKKNNSDEEEVPADDSGDDDEFGYGMVPKRQRRD